MTYRQYLDLVDSCYDSGIIDDNMKNTLSMQKIYTYYEQTELLPPEMDDIEFNKFIIWFSAGKSSRTVQHNLRSFELLYDYLLKEGVYVGANPTASAINDPNNIIEFSQEILPFYYRADVRKILTTSNFNNPLYKALFYSFFEGVVKNYNELHDLKTTDLDYDNQIIMSQRGPIKISSELCEAYKELEYTDYIFDSARQSNTGLRRTRLIRDSQHMLVPATRQLYNNGMSQRFILVTKTIGQKISPSILYYDGFIEIIIHRYGLDWFRNFMQRDSRLKSDSELIAELQKERKFNIEPRKIKNVFRPYVLSLFR